ncbi:transmembrane adaptor Erv26-domain-containing protein [Armillaria luteobubalina]|uniref:Transmembrane adaptor Erv26-domain-containing protein n=1 Tax=Armillaria luteobubalina TaxID=153913 RepID=A0AA39QE37_9AGAR|nr:transmembrane adaptor Erv26-domain-containing protein [Armillaria luteobubalina]
MALLHYISYAAVLAALAFVILALASGLLYISELIEEHSRLAKTIGQRGIYAIICLHLILCVSDSLPIMLTAFSIICHVVYLQNFSKTWPLISLSSPSFISSCVLVIVDHFLWFFHFSKVTATYQNHLKTYRGGPTPIHYGFKDIATFFGICVWLVPLFLFLSLSANDNALPTSSGISSPATTSHAVPQQRMSLFRSIFSMLSKARKDEGIIAPRPRSPYPAPSPTFPPPSPRVAAYSTLSPPRSPGRASLDVDGSIPSSRFRLGAPPQRRATAGDTAGLGLRKTSASSIDALHQE